MAQRVFGIDLGAFAVKVSEAEVGFRSSKLLRLHTVPVQHGPESPLERSLAALRELDHHATGVEVMAVGFPGDRVLLRLLNIPFAEPRKVGAVVGNELADDIPWEFEDVVYDFAGLPVPQGRVLAVAARTAEIRDLLERLSELAIEPRALSVAPLCYAGLVRRLDPTGTALVVDVGHLRTNVCLVHEGIGLMARTISRAGHQLTEAFRQTFQVSYQEAETLKERQAQIVHEDELEQLHPDIRRFATVTHQSMAPLIREIRLTAGIFAAELGRPPDRLLLCGGTSLVRGLARRLAEETAIPTERMRLSAVPEFQEAELTEVGESVAALSLGIALEQGGRRAVDLRQGEFAYRTDRSVLSDKLVYLAVSLVVVLVFAAFNAFMSLHALRKEEKTLKDQFTRVSKAVLGEVVSNPKLATRTVRGACRNKVFGIPKHTAFDILDMLSKEIPGPSKVKLDLNRLDIKPGKTYLKGTADSRSAVGDIVKALEKNKCFTEVVSGKISDVSEGKKQFSLTITTDCF